MIQIKLFQGSLKTLKRYFLSLMISYSIAILSLITSSIPNIDEEVMVIIHTLFDDIIV